MENREKTLSEESSHGPNNQNPFKIEKKYNNNRDNVNKSSLNHQKQEQIEQVPAENSIKSNQSNLGEKHNFSLSSEKGNYYFHFLHLFYLNYIKKNYKDISYF
jgi:hypothetical protein